jgi:hypothetical protein
VQTKQHFRTNITAWQRALLVKMQWQPNKNILLFLGPRSSAIALCLRKNTLLGSKGSCHKYIYTNKYLFLFLFYTNKTATMAHEPKLEIYRLKLINKEDGRATQFRNSFRENIKAIASLPKPKQDSDIYREFYKDFINSIDNGKGYKKSDKKEKAFKIAKEKNENGQLTSLTNSPLDNNFIINGILEGGKYGIKRNLGNINDAGENSDINKEHVVGDRFFFLLYAPIDFHTGILLIQGYTESKISDVFRDHIVDYFKV